MKPKYSLPTSIFLSWYTFIKKLGILDLPLAQWLFRKAYFLYKRLIEDPFHGFCAQNRSFLNGKAVIDIGANLGYTVVEFAKAVGKDGQVIAFEPEPSNYSTLVSITNRASIKDRITTVQSAIGSSNGSAELWLSPEHHADHRITTKAFAPILESYPTTTTVPITSLDDYLRIHPVRCPIGLIKIDVQGYEPAVCDGMIETLRKNPGCWVTFEHCPAQIDELGFTSEGLLNFFTSRGYSLFLISKNGDSIPLTDTLLSDSVSAHGYAVLLAKPNPPSLV